MGLFDLFDSITYGIGDAVDTVKEKIEDVALDVEIALMDGSDKVKEIQGSINDIGQDFRQFREDLSDIAVTTFIPGAEVECSSDIRDEAKVIIEESNEKYQKEYVLLSEKVLELNKTEEQIYKRKEMLAKRLNLKFHCNILIPSEIESVEFEQVEKKRNSLFSISSFEAFYRPLKTNYKPVINLIKSCKRLEEAKKCREEALDYQLEMEKELVKLEDGFRYVLEISNILEEENELLGLLEMFMDKKENVCYEGIAHQIEILLAETILDDTGKRNVRYQNGVRELEQLLRTTK